MLILFHDKYGCDCQFDTDVATFEELVEFAFAQELNEIYLRKRWREIIPLSKPTAEQLQDAYFVDMFHAFCHALETKCFAEYKDGLSKFLHGYIA